MRVIPDKPVIGVVGGGAIGTMLSAYLGAAGHRVVVSDVLEHVLEAIERDGVAVDGVGEARSRVAQTCRGVAAMAEHRPDLVFVCVKAPVLAVIGEELAQVCGPETVVVSFQNGLDTELEIAKAVGSARTLRTVVNFAGGLPKPGQAHMVFFHKPNYTGAIEPAGEPAAQDVAELLTACGLETAFTTDIRRYVWEKVILNCGLSPVCALTGQMMREAMTLQPTVDLVEDILREGIAVATADGCQFPDGFLEHCVGYLSSAGFHKPSMLVDVEASSKTEIDYLSAKIAEYGQRHGVPAPVNATITRLVNGIDAIKGRGRSAE